MKKSPDPQFLPVLQLGKHCPVPWKQMAKDGKARWCLQCQRKVYYFARMTAEEVLEVFAKNPERIGARVGTDSSSHVRTFSAVAGLILSAVLAMPAPPLTAQNQVTSSQPSRTSDAQSARTKQPRLTGVRGVVYLFGGQMPGVNVTVARTDGKRASTVTGADGAYSFTDLLPGLYSITFQRPVYHQSWDIRDVQVCEGTMLVKLTKPSRFTLMGVVGERRPGEPPNSSAAQPGRDGIEGRLSTAAGEAIPHGKLVATRLSDHAVRVAATDPSGRFSLLGLAPGAYVIAFSAPGFASQTLESPEVVPGYVRWQDAHLCRANP